jgi:hypothetical protein
MAVPLAQYQVSPAETGVTGKHNAGEVGVMAAGCWVPAAINELLGEPKLTNGRKIVFPPGSVAPATNNKHSSEIINFEDFIFLSICIVRIDASSRRKLDIKI